MNNSQLNTSNPAIRRILSEIKKLRSEPSDDFEAHPAEDNLFDWHFVLRGPAETPFAGGLYHGRIILPAQYPYKPPEFMFLCPTGRFEVGKKICLSISQHHPELWQPGWDIRTALTAIQSFMPTAGNGAIAALDYSDEERRRIADKSREASTVSLRSHGMLDHFEEFLQRPTPSDSPAARGSPASAQGPVAVAAVAAATDAASPPAATPRFQSVRTSWVEEGSKPASLDDAVAADAAAALQAESAPTFGGVPVSGPQNPSPASPSHRGPPAPAAGAPVAGTQPLPVPPRMDVGAGPAAAAAPASRLQTEAGVAAASGRRSAGPAWSEGDMTPEGLRQRRHSSHSEIVTAPPTPPTPVIAPTPPPPHTLAPTGASAGAPTPNPAVNLMPGARFGANGGATEGVRGTPAARSPDSSLNLTPIAPRTGLGADERVPGLGRALPGQQQPLPPRAVHASPVNRRRGAAGVDSPMRALALPPPTEDEIVLMRLSHFLVTSLVLLGLRRAVLYAWPEVEWGEVGWAIWQDILSLVETAHALFSDGAGTRGNGGSSSGVMGGERPEL